MPTYQLKPVTFTAVQWHAAGDHPNVTDLSDSMPSAATLLAQGIGWLPKPGMESDPKLGNGYVVRPGCWVLTPSDGSPPFVVDDATFKSRYARVGP